MEWLTRGWDREHFICTTVGVAAGVCLVLLRARGLAEVGSLLVAVCSRWAMWQIPPPGRSRAPGMPADGLSRLGQIAVVVLGVTLLAEVAAAPFQ